MLDLHLNFSVAVDLVVGHLTDPLAVGGEVSMNRGGIFAANGLGCTQVVARKESNEFRVVASAVGDPASGNKQGRTRVPGAEGTVGICFWHGADDVGARGKAGTLRADGLVDGDGANGTEDGSVSDQEEVVAIILVSVTLRDFSVSETPTSSSQTCIQVLVGVGLVGNTGELVASRVELLDETVSAVVSLNVQEHKVVVVGSVGVELVVENGFCTVDELELNPGFQNGGTELLTVAVDFHAAQPAVALNVVDATSGRQDPVLVDNSTRAVWVRVVGVGIEQVV